MRFLLFLRLILHLIIRIPLLSFDKVIIDVFNLWLLFLLIVR